MPSIYGPIDKAKRRLSIYLIILTLLVPTYAFIAGSVPLARATTTDSSWNPHVSCQAVVTSDHGVIGNHFDSTTEGALESGGPYGVFATNQTQIGSTSDLQPDLSPPCTYPNVNGTMAPTFVEIHGISLTQGSSVDWGSTGGKCGTHYQGINGFGSYPGGATFCTSYGVFQDTSEYTGNCETLDNPNPKICIRLEIDRDWYAAGFCGPGTACDSTTFNSLTVRQKIDVQGFVAWHPPSSAGHGYSSWEIHPLAAWRLTPTSTPLPGISWTPTNPAQGQTVTFTGTVTGGSTPYSLKWNFGDGTTTSGSPVNHVYSAAGTYSVTLNVTDANGSFATTSKTITIASSLSTSFTFSPSNPSAGTSVSFTAIAGGGVSPYSFNWNFGDGGSATGSPASHTFSAGGTYLVTLATTDSAGQNAVVSNNVTVQNPDFKLSSSSTLLTVQVGQNIQQAIAVTSVNSFQGTVSFTVTGSPSGLTVSMQNPSVNLSSGQSVNDNLKVSASNTTRTGVYVVTVRGTSGSLVHALNVTVRVPDFSMTANPTTLDLSQGATGTSQITFQSINGFSGGVSTQLTVSPGGPKPTLSPNNPTLSANGTIVSVLSVQIPANQAAGIYNVTIKATAGQLVHSLVVTIFVGQHTSSTSVSCSPSSVIVNQASNCTATINDTSTGPTTPTGTVTFSETGPSGSFSSTSCTLVSGSCSVTFTPSGAGNAQITGVYSGDVAHSGSTSAVANVAVGLRASSVNLLCSSPVVVNQTSSCTATVSDSSPGTAIIPTGVVSFNETGPKGFFSSPACTLVSGSCSLSFTAVATGTAVIVAAYNGDSAHGGSAGSASIVVNPRTTSAALVCTSPVVVNQASNCTDTITDTSTGGYIYPTGNITFVSGSAGTFSSVSCTVSSVFPGMASCSVSYTPSVVGNHLITGSYGGDSVHSSSSGASTIVAGQRSTGTSVSCSPTGIGSVQACTATASDTSPGISITPVGSVSFTTNSTGAFNSNTCTLSGTGTPGTASCQVTYTPATIGTHTITGTFSGDTIHTGSQGSTSISFGKDSTATSIACSPSSVAINQASTCTATVTDTGLGQTNPTGTVSFASSGTGSFAGSPCTLVSQNATSSSCQITYTPTSGAGTHSISASYGGDATHNGSASSPAFALTVTLRTTTTSVNCSSSSVVVNQATTCTAVVVDSSGSGAITPSGTALFTPGGSCTLASGSCSVSISPSSSGSLTVSASYGGDSSHGTSSASTAVVVGKRATSTSVSCSPNPATNNTLTACTVSVADTDVGARITPRGSVNFASNSTGVFSQVSCTLSPSGTAGVASCLVNYTPGVTGSHMITGSYAGDSSHLGSGGSAVVTVVAAASKPAYALVVSTDGKVSRLYQNGTLVLIGQPVTTPLRSVAWKPDGSYALITGDFAVLIKYDGTTLTTVSTGISTGYNFWTVSWKPDGSYALVGGSAGLLFRYDGVRVTIVTNPFATTIFSISWNPSGSYALLVGRSGLVLTYDATSVRSFSTGTVYDLDTAAWNPNGAYALIGGLNRTLLQFNGTQVTSINTSIVPSGNAIRAIAFNAAGSLALLAGDNGMVLTYNGSTLSLLPTLTSSWLYSVSWSSSGTAYIVGNGGTVLTYSNGTLTKLSTNPLSTSNFRGIAWKPQ